MESKMILASLFCSLATNVLAQDLYNVRGYCAFHEFPNHQHAGLYDRDGSSLSVTKEGPTIERSYMDMGSAENGFDIIGEFPVENGDVVVVDKNLGFCYLTSVTQKTTDEERRRLFEMAPKYEIKQLTIF